MGKAKRILAGTLVVALVAVFGYQEWTIRQLENRPLTVADTVVYDALPTKDKKEQVRERTSNRTLRERLVGVDVIPAEAGEGPVVIYKESLAQDTSVARVELRQGVLRTRLAVPDSSGYFHYVDLPEKDLKKCLENHVITASGLVRCNAPALGVLDVYTGIAGIRRDDYWGGELEVGLEWRRYTTSPLSGRLGLRPGSDPALTLGIEYRFRVLGH
jgi:hypothetical protein